MTSAQVYVDVLRERREHHRDGLRLDQGANLALFFTWDESFRRSHSSGD